MHGFLAEHLAVSPRLDDGEDPHISVLRFVGDTDLSAVDDADATYRAGRLLATLHAISGRLPESQRDALPVWDSDTGARQAATHAAVLDALDKPLAERLRGIAQRLPRPPQLPLVLAHGDASPTSFCCTELPALSGSPILIASVWHRPVSISDRISRLPTTAPRRPCFWDTAMAGNSIGAPRCAIYPRKPYAPCFCGRCWLEWRIPCAAQTPRGGSSWPTGLGVSRRCCEDCSGDSIHTARRRARMAAG
ncbi:hypothetical protein DDD63_10845 [Actinobaculum sp. 313]|nr:hypothetical protein DDD63_10845 [Actinobaculum sp. 313]